jgi:hypothetical protein
MTDSVMRAHVGRVYSDGWLVGLDHGRGAPTLTSEQEEQIITEDTAALVELVAAWIGEHCGDATHDGLAYAQEWREAMGA